MQGGDPRGGTRRHTPGLQVTLGCPGKEDGHANEPRRENTDKKRASCPRSHVNPPGSKELRVLSLVAE